MKVSEIRRKVLDDFPTAPNLENFYANESFVEKVFGRYTIKFGDLSGKVNLRLSDYEGYAPSLTSVLALPKLASTYLLTRKHPILRKPKPFLVYDAVNKIEAILRPGMKVLELGGGNSTLWFLDRGCIVDTIEHSPEWAAFIEKFARTNRGQSFHDRLKMHVSRGAQAIDLIRSFPDASFDLVLIDSMNEFTSRYEGAQAARAKAKAGGWIVLDNSDAPVNWTTVKLLGEQTRERFTGYAYMTPCVSQTSFWRV